MNDFKELNGIMKNLIEKHRSEFFKRSRARNAQINITNHSLQLNLTNPIYNTRDDPRANIPLHALKKSQK
jgi:hypothetical protein